MVHAFNWFLVPALLTSAVTAQFAPRVKASLKVRGGEVVLSYGAMPLGTHGLHELEIGRSWRMGQGQATTIRTKFPLVSGDGRVVIAPGTYQTQIYRAGERELLLAIGGDVRSLYRLGRRGRGLGQGGRGFPGGFGDRGRRGPGGGRGDRTGGSQAGKQGGETRAAKAANSGFPSRGNGLAGALSEESKPTKKLEITWVKPDKSFAENALAKGSQATTLRVDFGPHRLDVPMWVVGGRSKRVAGFQALAFTHATTWFRDRLSGGAETPVLALFPRDQNKREPLSGYNVFVGRDHAVLVAMEKPAPGFGAPGGRGGATGRGGGAGTGGRGRDGMNRSSPSPSVELTGTVEWTPVQVDGKKAKETVTISALKTVKKRIRFQIHTGTSIGTVSVPLPPSKSR